ncbi:MAG: T9SS type A sorting domain-containing protein [Bacteroidetes bacterium]|nr:T9SS type A sorting domain-containing protein [Bacteroidota bacterium]MCL2301820.1 T9SS type A sorting domain-containing protein [Lentimicrobiaceae bacterium]
MKKLLLISPLFLIVLWLQAQTGDPFGTTKNQTDIPIAPVFITGDCNPPTNLTAEHVANGNKLTWNLPAKAASCLNTEVLRYCTDNIDDGFGMNGPALYNAAISFPADVIANYVGRTITSIKVALHGTAFELRDQSVWIRNSVSGANLVTKAASFIPGQWTEIFLDEPYTITSGTLAIGYTCVVSWGFILAVSNNTQNVTHGGNISISGSAWTTLAAQGFGGNLCIQAVVDGEIPYAVTTNIYRDDIKIASYVEGTTYTDIYNPYIAACYKVEINCPDGGASPKSNEACVENVCDPVANLAAKADGNNNSLVWNMPDESFTTVSQSNNFANDAGGFGANSFSVFHRFTPAQLAAVDGKPLTQFVFIPFFGGSSITPSHDYYIKIYDGGTWLTTNRHPGTLRFAKILNNNSLTFFQENMVAIDPPIIIDATKELWIGYEAIAKGEVGYPAAIDMGPRKEGLGNIVLFSGAWNTLAEISPSGGNLNWYMKGRIITESVNIYRNNIKIESDLFASSYNDHTWTANHSCYQIEKNCRTGGTALLSNESCVTRTAVSDPATATFMVSPNPTTGELRITNYELQIENIEITDVSGRKVGSKFPSNSLEGWQPQADGVVFNISHLPNGIYFIRLTTTTGILTQKIIKN